MPEWTPDPDVVRRLRERARAGASLEELQVVCGVGGIAQAAYFARAFRVPLPELTTWHAWIGVEHEAAVAQRRELLALVRQAVAGPDVEEV